MKEIQTLERELRGYPSEWFVCVQTGSGYDDLQDGLVICSLNGEERGFIQIPIQSGADSKGKEREEELPLPSEIRGISPDFTGELTTEEYIRSLRGEGKEIQESTSEEADRAYEEACSEAKRARDEAIDEAHRACDEAIDEAHLARDEAIDEAHRAYGEAIDKVWVTYGEALTAGRQGKGV